MKPLNRGLGIPWRAMTWLRICQIKTLDHLCPRIGIAVSNGFNALVGYVVYVAGQGNPPDNAFDMVGHDPNMLKIPAMLHARNQVHPNIWADLQHFVNKNFVPLVTLAWKLISLDISLGVETSKFGNAIQNS